MPLKYRCHKLLLEADKSDYANMITKGEMVAA